MKVRWLQSNIRKLFLTYRFYNFPLFFGNKPITEVYLSLNDPHSFMLVQVLPELEQRFNITFHLYLVAETTPGPEVNIPLLKLWALKDANYIADKYGLNKVNSFPNIKALVTGQQYWVLNVKNVHDALNVFNNTWFDRFEEHFPLSTPLITAQINNQRRLIRKGHHASASIFFCGEWFVGVDRLEHLELLLNEKCLSKGDDVVLYNKNSLQLFDNKKVSLTESKIEAFISLNSPFAYIGLVQAKKLSEKYDLPLTIKPLVPIDMRGVVVPEYKKRYAMLDAAREAKKLHIAFKGYIDPLGQGIINTYKLFMFAEKENKSYEFIEAAFEAIYVIAIDLSLDQNIKQICAQIGIDYDGAIEYSKENDWQQWSDDNHLSLNDMGLWGVPCFRFNKTSCWGQDRLVQIENAILAG